MCHSSGCSPISCVHHSAILQSPAQHAVVPQRGGSTFVRCHLMTTLCTVGLRLVSRELRAMKRRLFLILTLIRHRGDVKARLLRHWLAGSICQSPTRLPWPSPCKLFGGRSAGEAQFRPGTSSRMGVPRGRSDDHFRVGSGRCGSASGRPTTGVIAEGPPVFHVLNVLFPLLSCPASFSSPPALLSSSPACFPLLCVFHLLFFFPIRVFFSASFSPPYCFGLIFSPLSFPVLFPALFSRSFLGVGCLRSFLGVFSCSTSPTPTQHCRKCQINTFKNNSCSPFAIHICWKPSVFFQSMFSFKRSLTQAHAMTPRHWLLDLSTKLLMLLD